MEGLQRPSCCVTKEVIEVIANANPAMFKQNGNINLEKILHLLGFDLNVTEDEYNGYYLNRDVYIRDPRNPSKLYKTSTYSGMLRKQCKVDFEGNPVRDAKGRLQYTNHWHEWYDLYVNNEVLHPYNLSDILTDDKLFDILDVGNEYYIAQDKEQRDWEKRNGRVLNTAKTLSKEEYNAQLENKYSWAKDYNPQDKRDLRNYHKMYCDKDQGECYLSDLEDIHGNVS